MMRDSRSLHEGRQDTAYQMVKFATTISLERLRQAEAWSDFLSRPKGSAGEQYATPASISYEKIDALYESVLHSAADEEMFRLINGILADDKERLRPLEGRVLKAIDNQDIAEASKLFFNEYSQARDEHQMRLNMIVDRAAFLIRGFDADEPSKILSTGLTFLLGLFLLACGLAFYLARTFRAPIYGLKYVAEAIAAGELKHKLSLNREDEFGDMAEALNLMVDNLRKMNKDLNDQLRSLREMKGALDHTQNQLALQEHMMQQEKMASLGRLVAGVAHELNNPISFVYSNAVLLRKSIADLRMLLDFYDLCEDIPEAIKADVERLKQQIDYDYLVSDITQAIDDCHEGSSRVRDIVLNLKMFSRTNETQSQKADITETIESAVRMLGQFFRSDRVTLHRDYGDLPEVECFAGLLSQVWMNLLVNAAQAMNSRGDIWVTTRLDDDQVLIKIRDNGPGIPEDTLIRVFDPFFTTKAVGEGTGLGLSIVHGIIERHSGEISVESKLGFGTVFTVRLPVKLPLSTDMTEQEREGVLV
ncbi:MAG TPA: ATP-binding protein [Blastocatellia bacterium]|nr:ATP-binding protein [Blastocatellia bacterium]